MIYGINKHTREHVIYRQDGSQPKILGSVDWMLVEADDDGWIQWDARPGAECPLPEGADCDIRHEDGYEDGPFPARQEKWSGVDADPGCKIVAYRPILAAEPEAPVTEVVETDFAHLEARVMAHQLEKLADLNTYCQKNGIGKWGDNVIEAIIEDHKRLRQALTEAANRLKEAMK